MKKQLDCENLTVFCENTVKWSLIDFEKQSIKAIEKR